MKRYEVTMFDRVLGYVHAESAYNARIVAILANRGASAHLIQVKHCPKRADNEILTKDRHMP